MDFETVASVAASIATAIAAPLLVWQLWSLTRHQKIEGDYNMMQWDRELWQGVLENPERAPEILQSVWGEAGIKPSEALMAVLLFDQFDHLYHRQILSPIPADLWETHKRYIRRCLQSETVRAAWTHFKDIRSPGFVSFVDGLLAERSA
jgi:hypothetical protein